MIPKNRLPADNNKYPKNEIQHIRITDSETLYWRMSFALVYPVFGNTFNITVSLIGTASMAMN